MVNLNQWKKVLALVTVLVLGLVVVACGAGDDTNDNLNDTVPGDVTNDNDITNGLDDNGLNDNGVLSTPIIGEDSMTIEPTNALTMTEETPTIDVNVVETPAVDMTETPMIDLTETPMIDVTEPAPAITSTDTVTSTGVMTSSTTTADTMNETAVVRGSDIIGANIYANTNDEIAEVKDILFDPSGEIQYVILDVQNMSEDFPYYAVDWDTAALSLDNQANAVQTSPSALLYEGDNFDFGNAIGLDDATVGTDDVFYQAAAEAGADTQMLDGLLQLSAFSNFSLFDYNLMNANTDEDMGEVEELLVNLDKNKVDYAVADIGGWLGIGETAVAIPWDRVTFDTQDEDFVIDASEDELSNAPAVDLDQMNDTTQATPDWEQQLDDYWGSSTMTNTTGTSN